MGNKSFQTYKQEIVYSNNIPIIDVLYKKNKIAELVILKNIKNEYKKLITFFGFRPTKKSTIKFIYTRQEMNKHWGEKSTVSAMVDNKNPNLIYIFSPLVFEKLTEYKVDYMISIIIHEIAHTFISEINKRCFAWMNEGLCEYLSENTKNNVIKKENWIWLKDNQILKDPTISWREIMKHEGYIISHNLVSYIIKTKGKNKIFELLKIRRIKDKNLKDKINITLGEDIENLLIRFEKRLILKKQL